MAGKKQSSYRIKYYKADGRVTTIRYAKFYSLWIGTEQIRKKYPIPASKRKVADKEKYLKSVIARETRKVKVKEIEKEVGAVGVEEDPQLKLLRDGFIKARSELLSLTKQTSEDPITLPYATIEDVIVTPFYPKFKDYSKELIDKRITTEKKSKLLALNILNFNLAPENYIQANSRNFDESYLLSYAWMMPHIYEFWKNTSESSEKYILRIKFTYDKSIPTQSAVSRNRQENRPNEPMFMDQLFKSTYNLIKGLDPLGTSKAKNYLANVSNVWITGFTLESSHEENL